MNPRLLPNVRTDLRCPECGAPLVITASRFKPFYGCSAFRDTGCKGSHGAQPDGSPMGVPASMSTKRARIEAHRTFDQLWKGDRMSRRKAYHWMRDAMHLTEAQGHIGKFTIEQCEELIAHVERRLARRTA